MKCRKCDTEKADDQMKLRAGKPSQVCLECDEKAKAERERIRDIVKKAKGEKKRKSKNGSTPRQRKQPEHQSDEPELEVEAGGLGFSAFICDDGRLQISQDSDNVVLVRREVRQFFEKFAPWAGFDLTDNN